MSRAAEALEILSLASAQTAEKRWKDALDDSIKHVLLVVANNPRKSMRLILARPDVRRAISEPFADAGAETVVAIRQAWQSQAGDAEIDATDLEALIRDARRNATVMPRVMASILRTTSDRSTLAKSLRVLADDYTRRAGFGVHYASQRARNLRLEAKAPPGSKKQWWGPPWANQCAFCAGSHGTVVDLGKDFPLTAGGVTLKPYGGALPAPPAHPRCRCRLRIIKP